MDQRRRQQRAQPLPVPAQLVQEGELGAVGRSAPACVTCAPLAAVPSTLCQSGFGIVRDATIPALPTCRTTRVAAPSEVVVRHLAPR
jgi:hypothetical protein